MKTRPKASVPTPIRANHSAEVHDEELGRREEQDEEQVPDDHVHEESERQRERADDEGRDELDRRDDDVHRPRHPGGEEGVLEELARALLDTGVDEGDVGHQREHQRDTDDRGTGQVQPGDDARQVHREDHEEDGRQDRQEPEAVLLAEQVFRDVDADEAEPHLGEALRTAGDEAHLARRQPEEQEERDHRDEPDQDDPVDREGRAFEEDDVGEELVDRRTVELAIFGGHRCDQVHGVSEQHVSPVSGAWSRALAATNRGDVSSPHAEAVLVGGFVDESSKETRPRRTQGWYSTAIFRVVTPAAPRIPDSACCRATSMCPQRQPWSESCGDAFGRMSSET